jgi:hypothetical protein
MTKSFATMKSTLLAAVLGALALNAVAQPTETVIWTPADSVTDGDGFQYANWNDVNNWSTGVVPTWIDPVTGSYYQAHINGTPGAYTACILTNNIDVGQMMMGDSGGGILIITNGITVNFAISGGTNNGEWTGVGFPNGPASLYIYDGSTLTLGSHLWLGQGDANGGPNTVYVDGSTLNIPSGQLGVSWSGGAGTNYLVITNGGTVNCGQWSSQSFGFPGSGSKVPGSENFGVLNLADNASHLVINGNQTASFNILITNGQFLAYGGAGTITYAYNPALNVSVVSAVAPIDQNTPKFSLQPSNTVAALNGTITLNSLVSNVPVNYVWQFDGTNLVDGNGYSGTHTANLTIAGLTAAQAGVYSVVATNSSHATEVSLSLPADVTANSFGLYPVVTINGINGATYTVQWASSLTPPVTWNTLATVTEGAGAAQVVDTGTPLSLTRFYRVVQQ